MRRASLFHSFFSSSHRYEYIKLIDCSIHGGIFMKKIIAILLCLGLFCLSLACFASCTQKNERLIRINEVTHSVFYAPLYVAINGGYFEEYNLQTTLTNGGGSDKSMTALISGDADIALLGPETSVYVKSQGASNSAKIFAQLTQRDGSFLIGRTAQEDFEWNSLKGKTIIGGRRGGMPAMCLEYAVYKNGLVDKTDVFIDYDVQFDLITAAFESGIGDYCTMFEPAASQYQSEKKGYIVASVGEEIGNVAYTCFMATEKYMAKHPEVVKDFTKAIMKAIDYCHTHSANEIAALIAPSFATTDVKLLAKALQSYIDIDAWTTVPYMTEESFDTLQNILMRAGTIDKKIAYGDVVDNSIIDAVINE